MSLLPEAQRVMVIGCGGAGKSTFAGRLATTLQLPIIHLDTHFWQPGWVETPEDEWKRTVETLASADSWVMDGNYGGTMDIRMERAEVVIFMDFSRYVCLWGIARRRFSYANRSRPDMAVGCPEKIDWHFVRYVWNYRRTRRPGILQKLRDLPDGKRTIILRNRREAEEFLAGVGGQDPQGCLGCRESFS